ncbi:MAG: hypothetical protein IPN14_17035 [Bacteroidetes bacterium]|nr:hypothetical protein [Bacteroidota bacterium]
MFLRGSGQKYAQLVIPHYPASVQSVDKAIGSYPDKIIAKINKGATLDKAEIQLEAITSWANAIGLNENQKAHALNYFHIGCFILSASELNSISSDSFIQTINRILDLYDMQHLYHPSASEFLKIFNTEKDNTIIKAMYKLVGRDIDNYKFPSIRQIAAADQSNEVQYKLSVLDETKLESSTKEEKIKLINRFNIELSELNLKKYHDYVAIITADGDNFGKYVSSLGNDLEALREFTRKVDSYNKLAATICIDYSATPIYIGGDDLLIFAPVLNNRAGINKSVFSLIQELDSSFKSTFNSIQFDIQGNKFKLTFIIWAFYYLCKISDA